MIPIIIPMRRDDDLDKYIYKQIESIYKKSKENKTNDPKTKKRYKI